MNINYLEIWGGNTVSQRTKTKKKTKNKQKSTGVGGGNYCWQSEVYFPDSLKCDEKEIKFYLLPYYYYYYYYQLRRSIYYKITSVKCTIWWVLMKVYSCSATATIMVWRTFSLPWNVSLHPLMFTQSLSNLQHAANTDLVFISMALLFLDFHVNGIFWYVAFCACLFSLSVLLWRLRHVLVRR